MVPEEPPAPAARVEAGRALRRDSLWSAAARRRRAVRGPPGGVGDEGRLTAEPEAAAPAADLPSGPDSVPDARGDEARGDACRQIDQLALVILPSLNKSIGCPTNSTTIEAPQTESRVG